MLTNPNALRPCPSRRAYKDAAIPADAYKASMDALDRQLNEHRERDHQEFQRRVDSLRSLVSQGYLTPAEFEQKKALLVRNLPL